MCYRFAIPPEYATDMLSMSHRPSTTLSICRRCISICYRNALTLANRALCVCNEDPGICHHWAFERYQRHPCAIFTNAMCLPLCAHNRPCACCHYTINMLSVCYHRTIGGILPPSQCSNYGTILGAALCMLSICHRYSGHVLPICF